MRPNAKRSHAAKPLRYMLQTGYSNTMQQQEKVFREMIVQVYATSSKKGNASKVEGKMGSRCKVCSGGKFTVAGRKVSHTNLIKIQGRGKGKCHVAVAGGSVAATVSPVVCFACGVCRKGKFSQYTQSPCSQTKGNNNND